jgi:hypothetical protein
LLEINIPDSYGEEIIELCATGKLFVENYKRLEFFGIELSIGYTRRWCIIPMVMVYGRRIVVAVRLLVGRDTPIGIIRPRP